MTRDEYAEKLRQMTALELGAEVAEKVMEYRLIPEPSGEWFCDRLWLGLADTVYWIDAWGNTKTTDCNGFREFSPSTDIAAAWEVVEKLQQEPREWYFECHRIVAIPPGHYHAFFGGTIGYADTAPRAICIAACLAVWQDTAFTGEIMSARVHDHALGADEIAKIASAACPACGWTGAHRTDCPTLGETVGTEQP